MSETRALIRVLHVTPVMDRGGAETWIMNAMRRIDRRTLRFDFCVSADRAGAYDEEIRALGGTIVPCPWTQSLPGYCAGFRRILRAASYDVVHTHLNPLGGLHVWLAARTGVPQRFMHLHSMHDGRPSTIPRVAYRKLMRRVARRYMTRGLGCSRGAVEGFFGSEWQRDPRTAVVYYGVDLDPFDAPADRPGLRAELGLPPDAPLALHVGRFVEAKNHRGLIDIFRAVHSRSRNVHLLLAGEGALRGAVEAQVQQCGLTTHVHFLGLRSDVARLMKAADVLVMPSVREGMPVTMLEATAAGLPVVISDVPGAIEANDVCCRAAILPVDAGPEKWAASVIESLEAPRPDPAESLERVRRSPFSSDLSAQTMERIYREPVADTRG